MVIEREFMIFYKTDKNSSMGRFRRNAYIKAICPQCGIEFDRRLAYIRTNVCKYCSSSCSAKYQNTKQRLSEGYIATRICPEGTKVQKKRVVHMVEEAVKKCKIVSWEKCSSCGVSRNIEAHHEDYSKPFTIIWLCQSCHQKLHHGHTIKGKVILYD